MAAQSNAPIIIKKVKKVGGDGHHGGAWKVAYADFVTAMMAFFMLMWLLNATTEKQRKGIADYFSPTIPVNRVSGGGDGSFGGDSVFTEETLAQTGYGGLPRFPGESGEGTRAGDAGESAMLEEIEEMLSGQAGESMIGDRAMRHIVTQVTDEGLVIELFDLAGEPLFEDGTAVPMPVMAELAGMMSRVFALVENDLALGGHVRAQPIVVADNPSWDLSADRAAMTRKLLETEGFAPDRVQRVTGHADRNPVARNPMAVRNNRIELILLRSDRAAR
ncbi:flagellar motor protein MotB [Aliiroseovarius sp.]|uniref:flagellar motor protein MotB n=1 Tax=Aliiroseovarius sp. TaxID=1872442 RepID=UPI002634D9EF|nr:flagellar motor protein MotB [Aliiroseovarius sp.]